MLNTMEEKKATSVSSPLFKGILVTASVLLLLIVLLYSLAGIKKGFLDKTTYSTGFSEEKFASIKEGMTEKEVFAILGQPLKVSEKVGQRIYDSNWTEEPSSLTGIEYKWWEYSKPAGHTDTYEVRAIKFSPDGKTTQILSRHYED